MNGFVLLGILLVLLMVSVRERRSVRGRLWSHLRVLVPSWRFFDRIAPGPRLYYRTASARIEHACWQALPLPSAPRSLWSLLSSPLDGLRLAQHGVLERLLSDLHELEAAHEDGTRVEQLVSYELAANLVRAHVRPGPGAPAASFQFKLTAPSDPDLPDAPEQDVLISRVHAR